MKVSALRSQEVKDLALSIIEMAIFIISTSLLFWFIHLYNNTITNKNDITNSFIISRDELQYLEEESASSLNRFYNGIGHIKKEIKQK